MSDRVTVRIDGGIADVRLNRPDKINALDPAMFAAIVEAGEALKTDTTVRAVVLSGEGRGFCAGLDFGSFQQMAGGEQAGFPPVIVYTGRSLSHDQVHQLERFSRSIIIKGARSPERLLDEVTLFLHQVESKLPPERQRMLRDARDREAVFEGRRILVVEDDVRNVFALTSVLEPKGAIVEIARNGREAVEHVRAKPGIDLVLMDIMMPEMDGIDTMREIRKIPQLKKLPIIAVTAKAMKGDREKCIEAGAWDYLSKPVDTEQLLAVLRAWLHR